MRAVRWMRAALIAAGISVPLSLAASAMASPEVQQQGVVSFVSGGVGEDELQEMKKLSPGYPLELLFVTKGEPQEYLADVKVQIKDKDGKIVLDTMSQGPFLLAKMLPGKYTISADHDGTVKRQIVQVAGAKTRRIVFVWDGDEYTKLFRAASVTAVVTLVAGQYPGCHVWSVEEIAGLLDAASRKILQPKSEPGHTKGR